MATTSKCIGALLLALAATAGAALHYYSRYHHHDVGAESAPSDAMAESKRQQSRKQEKCAARIASRRASKDARLDAARTARSRQVAQLRLEMSDAQRREDMERVKMRRVEQYVRLRVNQRMSIWLCD